MKKTTQNLNDLFASMLGTAKKETIAPALFFIRLPDQSEVSIREYILRLQKQAYTQSKKFVSQDEYSKAIETYTRAALEYLTENLVIGFDHEFATKHEQSVNDAIAEDRSRRHNEIVIKD